MAVSTVSNALSTLMGALPQSTMRDASPAAGDATSTRDEPMHERAADGASREGASLLLARATALGALTYGRRIGAAPVQESPAPRPPLGVRGAMLDVRV
jgi:hypothetical protein